MSKTVEYTGGEDTETIAKVKAIRQTDKALLCKIDDDDVWVPKSLIHDDSEVYEPGHHGKLVVAQWFAEKEGLA